ncbi:MAG: methylenetetrahydrofolate reductase [NAD(P)H] [Coriobacteriia bacterium]|nr:methylenetetrahydrofolate reductase [NAD(P)H] [Coriobacteriia bacterium]
MRIIDLLNTGRPTISCELFPPKHGEQLAQAREVVHATAALKPAFISVTYGAGGGTSDYTISLADEVQNVCGIPVLTHLTCVSHDRATVRDILTELRARGIENVLALRGDIPEDRSFPTQEQGRYCYASELIEEIANFGGFCIGGACYPEGHPEAASIEADIENLKIKVARGCEFLTTQMFFDNEVLYRFLDRLSRAGIDVPIVAGIMPVTNAAQITRICALSGTELPPRLAALVKTHADDAAAMRAAGVAYATEQITDLMAQGVTHIHIYTMNKPDIAADIMANLN